jgi:gliding motility-associated-like protein
VATTIVNFGDGTIQTYVGLASFSHVYEQPGIYTVTVDVVSTLGCEYQTVYTNWIEAYSYPVAGFVINPNNVSMFNPYVTLINQSSPDAVVFDWQISGGTPLTSTLPSVDVQYPDGVPSNYPVTLTVENIHGCVDSITLVVNILNEILLYAPNTFTPDNDEFNQNWGIYISGINIFNFDLFIFNRWGEIIWESHDPAATWDGTFNGEIVQDGTYTWTIRCAALTNDDKHTFNGHLNVIR